MADGSAGAWLTYKECGLRFGVSTAAARQMSRRRGWQRRTPNAYGARAEILVPADALPAAAPAAQDAVQTPHEQVNGVQGPTAAIAFLERENALLRDTIDDLRKRLDAETEERRRLTLALVELQRRGFWSRMLRRG
jgi:hypothetical protein